MGLDTSSHSVRRLFFVYLACILASAVAAAVIVSNQSSTVLPDPFSIQQRSTVSFTLYYPTKLPEGLYIDIASVGRVQEEVVAVRITDGRGSKGISFSISQRILPPTANLQAFYESFANKSTFPTSVGIATAGSIDNGQTRIISLVTEDKTWILVQASNSIPLQTLQTSLGTLAPSR